LKTGQKNRQFNNNHFFETSSFIEEACGVVLFLYLISLFMFSYIEGLNIISNGLAGLFVFLVIINILAKRRKIVITKFIFEYLLFIFACQISFFIAVDKQLVLTKVLTLIQLFVIAFALINYLNSFFKIERFFGYYTIASFIASIYILLEADLANPDRIGENLGNVNTIGIIIAVSIVFCLYFIIEKRNILVLPVLLINTTVVALTGSRMAFIFIAVAVFVLFIQYYRNLKRNKVALIAATAIIAAFLIYLVFNVPILYSVIGKRIQNLVSFTMGESVRENSVYIRWDMLQKGVGWFFQKPLFGYGIDNFRVLYGSIEGGLETYSHNNIVELLVGIGLVGTTIFYYMLCSALHKLVCVRIHKFKGLQFSMIAILAAYLVASAGSVYYYSKLFTILLTVSVILFVQYNTMEYKIYGK